MRIRSLAPAAALVLAAALAAACNTDKVLSTTPTTAVPAAVAVNDPVSAAAAVAGMYNALLNTSYYGADFVIFGDLSGDNAVHTGTFGSYRAADLNALLSDNTTVAGIWRQIYAGINRANQVLVQVSPAQYLPAATHDQYLGEAYFLRALGLHNAMKFWGAVPVVTTPINTPADAATVVRADTGAVYKQILGDLDAAEKSMTNKTQTRQASVGAVRALRARVALYRGDWSGALAAAQSVDAMGYTLAPNYADLFSTTGSNTPEDIFRLRFNDTNANSESFYYYPKAIGGRYEVAPSADLQAAYPAGDSRAAWTIGTLSGRLYGAKYRSVTGLEHLHVIRYAEVLLAEAEALARLNRLQEAAVPLNKVRARAGVAPLAVTGTTTQQSVVDAIINERRLELALEGDRWPDMVRTDMLTPGQGLASAFLAAKKAPLTQVLYPIPQRDRDVAPGLTQNPGY